MPSIKCLSCGSYNEYQEGMTEVICETCDEPIKIKKSYDPNRQKMMDIANEYRLSCDFDRAARNYEAIINHFPDDAEAYWYHLMCEYGVEFVEDDRRHGKKKPTLHRMSSKSIFENNDYKKLYNMQILFRNSDGRK